MDIKLGKQAIADAIKALSNRGRWGHYDSLGTLNHIHPEDIAGAAGLIRSGKVFSLGIPFQFWRLERGTTRWRARDLVHAASKLIGRGVLLDIARFRGVDWLTDGESISSAELDKCGKDQNVEIRRGDFVILRTGQMERCMRESFEGYAGGNAPGVRFETAQWCQNKEIAALCADTWGVEVRPNETPDINQPWHNVVGEAMGMAVGEMFSVGELAADCADDGVYEFFFTAAPPIAPSEGTAPVCPQAVK